MTTGTDELDNLVASLRKSEVDRQEDQRQFRNVLAVIRVMARRTGDDCTDLEEYSSCLDGRLAAYIHVQSHVLRDGEMDLETLLADELLRFGLRLGEQVDLCGPPVAIGGHVAGLLAVAIHELITDLITLPNVEHDLNVHWSCTEIGTLSIRWISGRSPRERRDSARWTGWLRQALEQQLAMMTEESFDGARSVLTMRFPNARAPARR